VSSVDPASTAETKAVVSPNNPCPFLRALVAEGYIPGHIEPIGSLVDTIVAASGGPESKTKVSRPAVYLIALIANGLNPLRLWRTLRQGAELDALRGGPLDKRGVGSRILDVNGDVDESQLNRLSEFASERVDESGTPERGLDGSQLRAMMDANFARAKGHRRAIDRKLMDGEWPVLLRVMGKDSSGTRYLSIPEIRSLFIDERLPRRITERLNADAVQALT
jgi:hypothetical protein